ncbi:unnamed protein product [Heterobilharzia americana]|nr:unnamed protein product [Heterobilharzia americana]
MLVVYARIYQTASNLMKSLKSGEKIVVCSNPKSHSPPSLKLLTTYSPRQQKSKSWFRRNQGQIKSHDCLSSHFSVSQADTMILRIHRGGQVDSINTRSNNNLKTPKFKSYSKRNRLSLSYFDKTKIKRKQINNKIKFTDSICSKNKQKFNTVLNANTRIITKTKSCITHSVLANSTVPSVRKSDRINSKSGKLHWNLTYSLTQISLDSQVPSDGFNSSKLTTPQIKNQLNVRRSHSSSILSCLSQTQPISHLFKRHQYQRQQLSPCHLSTTRRNSQSFSYVEQQNILVSSYLQKQSSPSSICSQSGNITKHNNHVCYTYELPCDKLKTSVARLVMNQQSINNTSVIDTMSGNIVTTIHGNSGGDSVSGLTDMMTNTGQQTTYPLSKTKYWISQLREFAKTKRVCKFVREQKAAKTLGIVMGLFILCWLPFFVCNVVTAINPYSINKNETFKQIIIIVTWLGYINSCINPIIYAHSMNEFRRAFKRLLCCHWWYRKQVQFRKSTSFPLFRRHHHHHQQQHQHGHPHPNHPRQHSRHSSKCRQHHCHQHVICKSSEQQNSYHSQLNGQSKYNYQTGFKDNNPSVKYLSATEYQSVNSPFQQQNAESSLLSYSILLPNVSDSICSKSK